MNDEILGFLVLLGLSIVVALVLFLSVRSSLRGLLEHIVRLPSGVEFYLRSFGLVLMFAALSAAIGTSFDMKPDSHFMEYVWKVAGGLSASLELTLWIGVVYVVIVTVLIAALKVKDDK